MSGLVRRVAPHEIVVFLGPTLGRQAAETLLPARYLPPVACGDVIRALRVAPRVIAIVDGMFEGRAAVWHKEILLAMSRGVRVFGASSMGALRGAELAAFGMIGVGRIFEAYRDGLYTDDDEVAVLHSAAGRHAAVSEPMVNIRATLAHAVAERVIAAEAADMVLARAKRTFYQERSLVTAVEQSRGPGADDAQLDALLRFVDSGGYVDQKRLDALELIQVLSGLELALAAPPRAPIDAGRSSLLRTLETDVSCQAFEHGYAWLPMAEKVAVEARSLGVTYTLLCELARLWSLGDAVARSRNIVPTPKMIEHVFDQDDFGLGPDARDPAWAIANDLSESGFEDFVHRLARVRAVIDQDEGHGRSRENWRAHLLMLLRGHGEYERGCTARGAKGGRGAAVVRSLERREPQKLGLFRRMAKLWQVVDRAAEARGVGTDGLHDDELQDYADDFRVARGLDTRAATHAWLRRNDLDARGFTQLVTAWATRDILFHNAQTDTLGVAEATDDPCWFHDVLRFTGVYSRLRQDV
jgi:hypothetical protein